MATTQHNQQLTFLQDKIKLIRSAIFFNLSDSVIKLPTSLVTTLKVDDFGYVWFFVKKPNKNLMDFEKEFPVRMDYFKKGVDHFLQIMGKAFVVTDPEELNSVLAEAGHGLTLDSEMVLVKVKMLKAEFYESQTRLKSASWFSQALSSVTTWFRSSNNIGPNTYYPVS
jgi:general stress protein 26